MKTKLKDTKLGGFLKDKAPAILELTGDLLPDSGVLGVVKNLLDKGEPLSHEEQMEFARYEMELLAKEQEAVTRRWEADLASDVKLAKLIRPVTLIALLTMFIGLAVVDSIEAVQFTVKESYTDLLQVLMLTSFGAYFAGRSIEKTKK
jgi:hypothetical protein